MGGLFSKPKVQRVEVPAPVPLPDQPEIERARRRSLQEQQARTGRAATRLTQPAGTQGREYTRTTLG